MGSLSRTTFAEALAETQPDWLGGDADRYRFAIESVTLKSGDVILPQRSGVTAIVGANNAGKSTILRELKEALHKETFAHPVPSLSVARVETSGDGNVADLLAWLDRNSAFTRQNTQMGFVRPQSKFLTPQQAVNYWRQRDKGLGSLASFLCFYGNAAGRFSIGGSAEMRESVDDPPNHPVHYLEDSPELQRRISAISEEVFRAPLTLDSLARIVRLRVGKVEAESPRVNDISPDYRKALAGLAPLDEQGDGMRGFFGQIVPVISATYPLVILDEPEAFLHPPQAHALGIQLGKLAVERGIQILVATHDRNLLTGLLESEVDVSVVRASRTENSVRAFQLDADDLKKLWKDPVLKYSNVLDGLFHGAVVLAEAEGDCAFLSAGLDFSRREGSGIPRNEILFVPTGGKAAMKKVAVALKAVSVPVVVAPDLDMLVDEQELKRLVVAVGGGWDAEASRLWNIATAAQRTPREAVRVEHVVNAIAAAFGNRGDESFTSNTREEFMAHARSASSPWAEVKEYGISAFKSEAYQAVVELLERLDAVGVVIIRDGELERLAPEVPVRKGAGWLQAALSAGAQRNDRTQAHLDRIMDAATRLVEAQGAGPRSRVT